MASNSKIEWTDATWNPIRARVKKQEHLFAALEAQLAAERERLISVTWGELYGACPGVADQIPSHEWDNKNTLEQQTWLLERLASEIKRAEEAEALAEKYRGALGCATESAKRRGAEVADLRRQLEATRKALESADRYILGLRRTIYAPIEKQPNCYVLNDLGSTYTRDRTAVGDGALVGTVRALTPTPPEPTGAVAGHCHDIDGMTWHKDGDRCGKCGFGMSPATPEPPCLQCGQPAGMCACEPAKGDGRE